MVENNQITMEMIQEAMSYLEEIPEKIIFADDYHTVWGRDGFPSKIQLTDKGVALIEKITGEKFNGRREKR